jgi:hypothetical protein
MSSFFYLFAIVQSIFVAVDERGDPVTQSHPPEPRTWLTS